MNAPRKFWSTLASALLLASSSASVSASPEGDGSAGPGAAYTVLCKNPVVARDLIGVIGDAGMYLDWLTGYVLSGYCVLWADELVLARKLEPENTTADGRRAQLWTAHVPHGGMSATTRYAIVVPAADSTVAGLHF